MFFVFVQLKLFSRLSWRITFRCPVLQVCERGKPLKNRELFNREEIEEKMEIFCFV
jgi:hypothetical protein